MIETSDGAVAGLVLNGTNAYLGIPYAAPPVGKLRWRPPTPAPRWKKTLQATAYGNTCVQTSTLGVFAKPSSTEDCLYLNVFTPPRNPSKAVSQNWNAVSTEHPKKKPVMVWIHGGGLFDGESNDYDPSALVGKGVVVVTFNYRVNVFGFLAHPALDKEGHTSGNYGFMDQQFALAWVKKNIAKFDGDPGNVTIFGESAGGLSVDANIASPTAAGLFQRAIVESGHTIVEPLSTAEASGQGFATAVGCPDQTAACLRALSVDQIVQKGASYMGYAPAIVDGVTLPQPIRTLLQSGNFNRVDMLVGSNADEERFFAALAELATHHVMTADDYPGRIQAMYGPAAPQVLQKYPLPNNVSPSIAFSAAVTDSIACMAETIRRLASPFVRVYGYEFDDTTAPSYAPPVSFPYGAAHTSELQYIFPLFHGASGTPQPLNASQAALSDVMVGHWTSFAATGKPKSTGTTKWPQFENWLPVIQPLTLVYQPPVTTFRASHQCDFWDGINGSPTD